MPYSMQELSDIQEIREVAQRYCRGVDRLDEELMKSAYWPDATDDHGVYVGPAHTFVEHCMVSHLKWRSTSHCIFNHHIEIDKDGLGARGEIYNVTYLFGEEEDQLDTWYGRYLDRYQKRGDQWRIIERVCVNEGTTSQPVTPMQIDAAAFRSGSFDRPSTRRPVGP